MSSSLCKYVYPVLIYNMHLPLLTSFMVTDELNRNFFLDACRKKRYIDKSRLIAEFLTGTITARAVTGPEGFGKTTNLHMLGAFLDAPINQTTAQLLDRKKTTAYEIFKDLSIGGSNYKPLFDQHFSNYSVVHLGFDLLQGYKTYDEFTHKFRAVVQKAFAPFTYMYKHLEKVSGPERVIFNKTFTECYRNVIKTDPNILQTCGSRLCDLTHAFSKKKVIVLIDDLSTPYSDMLMSLRLTSAELEGMFARINALLENSVCKMVEGHPAVYRSYLTGVMRFPEPFSECARNLKFQSAFSSPDLIAAHGFNMADVSKVIADIGPSTTGRDELGLVETCFDGYRGSFSGGKRFSVCCTSSVVKFFNHRLSFQRSQLNEYWPNSAMLNLKRLMAHDGLGRQLLRYALSDDEYMMPVSPPSFTFKELLRTRKGVLGEPSIEIDLIRDHVFFFLYEHGFFTATENEAKELVLTMPNEAVRRRVIYAFQSKPDFLLSLNLTDKNQDYFKLSVIMLDESEEALERLTMAIGMIYSSRRLNLPAKKLEVLVPLYRLLVRSDVSTLRGNYKLQLQRPVSYDNGKEYVTEKSVRLNLFVTRSDNVGIVFEFKFGSGTSIDALNQSLYRRYFDVFDVEKYRPRRGYRRKILVGVSLNNSHCSCSMLVNSLKMAETQTFTIALPIRSHNDDSF